MKKTKKALASLAIAGMVLSMAPASVFAADDNRIAGADRYATSIKIAEKAYASATTAVIAAGNPSNLVDALAAAPLAAQEMAPIYLTDKADMNDDAVASLKKLGVSKVFVVGAAASEAVVKELKAAGLEVEELKGAGRVETADAINAKLTAPAGTIVVGYNGVADAMSVASYAAANNYAIVVAKADGSVPASVDADYIIGGPTMVKDIAGATRIFGADRYETNDKVLAELAFEFGTVYVGNGATLADALVASVLAAQTDSPILLSDGKTVEAAATAGSMMSSDSKVIALGGTGVVSEAALNSVKADVPDTLEVESVSAINLVEFEVKFTQEVDKTSAETEANYELDGEVADLAKLLEDGKTVRITMDTAFDQQEKVTVEVEDVEGLDGNKAPDYEEDVVAVDRTIPEALSVKLTGPETLEVTFSEAVKASSISSSDFSLDGGSYSVIFDEVSATNPRVAKLIIPQLDEDVYTLTIKANGIQDAASFYVEKTELEFKYVEDVDAPTVEVKSADETEVVLKFSEKVFFADDANVIYSHSHKDKYVADDVTVDGSEVTLDFTTNPLPEGTVNIFINYDDEDDQLIEDSWENEMEATSVKAKVVADETAPTVTSVKADGNDTIVVKYSEDVLGGDDEDNYLLEDSDGDEITITSITEVDGDEYELHFAPQDGGVYTLEITDITDDSFSENEMKDYTTTVTIEDENAPSVESATYNADKDKIFVKFSEAMSDSVLNLDNYRFAATDGTNASKLDKDTKISKDTDDSVIIELDDEMATLDTGNFSAIIVAGVKDLAGNQMEKLQDIEELVPATLTADIIDEDNDDYLARAISKTKVEFDVDRPLASTDVSKFSITVDGEAVIAKSVIFKNNTNGTATVTVEIPSADAFKSDISDLVKVTVDANGIEDRNKIKNGAAIEILVADIVDKAKPSVVSVVAVDSDDNNRVDQFVVTFSEAMYGPSISDSDFTVDGYTVDSITIDPSKKVVTVTVDERSKDDTAATPKVSFGTVQDANRNEVTNLSSKEATSVDDANAEALEDAVDAAQDAINTLAADVTAAADKAAKQAVIDAAQDLVDAVVDLDDDYDTTTWDGVIAAQQAIVTAL